MTGRARGAARRRRPPAPPARAGVAAFTLLEMLIALALVLALSAVAVPPLIRILEERTYESAVDVVSQQLLLARAHSSSVSAPVEVVYLSGTREVSARLFAAGIYGGGNRDAHAASRAGEADPRELSAESGDESQLIAEAWSTQSLPASVRISGRAPEPDSPERLTLDRVPITDQRGAGGEPERLRLAVYLPDGSTLLGRPVWVLDDDGRIGRLEVNQFTGLPRFRRLEGPEAPPEPEVEEPEEPEEPEVEAPERPEGSEEQEAGAPDRDDREAEGPSGKPTATDPAASSQPGG